ncbi:hypothetical protein [Plantactinospora sp. B24E8]|uniref:hypothetical protein n=1 Tax=Plantactinospora sp. B24E8 TaxID=3153567 RepID=UPI00325CFD67
MTDLPSVWLLDVDGVVNAARPGWGGPPRRDTVSSASDSCHYPMRWAPPLVDRIRTLHRSGLVEVRWCSTWCPDADALERLWLLPPLERAFVDPVKGMAASMAKLAAARRVLAGVRRLVWTDDAEVPEPGDPRYDELSADGRALLVRPSPRRGLQPADLDAIEAFARVGVRAVPGTTEPTGTH